MRTYIIMVNTKKPPLKSLAFVLIIDLPMKPPEFVCVYSADNARTYSIEQYTQKQRKH